MLRLHGDDFTTLAKDTVHMTLDASYNGIL